MRKDIIPIAPTAHQAEHREVRDRALVQLVVLELINPATGQPSVTVVLQEKLNPITKRLIAVLSAISQDDMQQQDKQIVLIVQLVRL